MNYQTVFYWLVVADNARGFFFAFAIIFTLVSVVSCILYLVNAESDSDDSKRYQAMSRKWLWWGAPIMMLFWLSYILTPSKKDALLIVAGGQTLNFLTTDSSSRQIPKELSGFVVTQLKSMAAESKVDLNITNAKEKILNEAKEMTSNEIINRMKSDTTFANVILKN